MVLTMESSWVDWKAFCLAHLMGIEMVFWMVPHSEQSLVVLFVWDLALYLVYLREVEKETESAGQLNQGTHPQK